MDAVKIGCWESPDGRGGGPRARSRGGRAWWCSNPVMVAESGARLLDEDADAALRGRLLSRIRRQPQPSRSRRAAAPGTTRTPRQLVRAIHACGPARWSCSRAATEIRHDLFFDGRRLVEIPGERHPDGAAHGSGCTHSSALAAHLALGLDPLEAARSAKRIAAEAVRDGLRGLGRGPGPVDVMGLMRRREGGIRIAGIDHVVLTVSNLPATVDFYERVLGMRPYTFADGTRTALAFAGQKLNLHELGREILPNAKVARRARRSMPVSRPRWIRSWLSSRPRRRGGSPPPGRRHGPLKWSGSATRWNII